MRAILPAALAALARLVMEAVPAWGEAADLPPLPAPARIIASNSGLGAAVRGQSVWPGHLVIVEPDGRMRTLELDDLTPLRVRITIPF